jgi:maltooligosyltrehalose trehalohydrolase
MTRLGATPGSDGSEFLVWAPRVRRVALRLCGRTGPPIPLEPCGAGYFRVEVPGIGPGDRYLYRLDGDRELPDPASGLQPDGVHGASVVVDPSFPWDESWTGLPLARYVFYELHVGAFTPEGTFDAVVGHLRRLRELGVTAIELMPVAQFPGRRNWGYDGVGLYAPQASYGGPGGLRRLVDACHREGLAAVLDVVYNHVGPEGNYLDAFGPYFTDRYRTPWGRGINLDGIGSDEVRRFFIENARRWISDFRFDALRLDAVHAIVDPSARPFLEELTEAVHGEGARCGRPAYVIAESDANDPRLVTGKESGGYGMDAMWNDDFHHALHALLTGERRGYYQDFGSLTQLGRAFSRTFVFTGQPSSYRGRRHGRPGAEELPPERFVVFSQNHDQVGNRMLGERLTALVSFESLKLAAGGVLLSPYIPLLFMGEEYGEDAPFLYFVSHGDPALVEAVRRGRKEEFSPFGWKGEFPDPQGTEAFLRSKIDWAKREKGGHAVLLRFYRDLIQLRSESPALSHLDKESMEVYETGTDNCLFMRRWKDNDQIFALFHFGEGDAEVEIAPGGRRWRKMLDSADIVWNGPGSLLSESFDDGTKTALCVRGRSFGLYRAEGAV